MKIGDRVIRTNFTGSLTWEVVDMKTDRRGYWIQLTPERKQEGFAVLHESVWHDAKYFEVLKECTNS